MPQVKPSRFTGVGRSVPRYNSPLFRAESRINMEAERINQIANRIADLESRGQELRRYL